ncbi:radical SAM protein with 4Fe4S-binding SPASM domain [Oceanotoga teriensis]|uniref:Radical SAM protein with 4Fe4S-binding SPASM domain n=1 Tax=Oceanotoga teriensis TaxID=515440 RepID=A0AA45C817_9BACT|nr:radical SAM protein [Oceanotoga teriensis]PWJ95673.1 radical SAM protein with 4Fe4S-binding SPASM domain [Oceanotoga teriensis]
MNEFKDKILLQLENRIIDDNYLIIQWHITNKCEENCKHCYLKNNLDTDFPYERIDETLNKIYDLSIIIKKKVLITLIGGDPLLNNHILNIIKKIVKMGFFFRISGNYHKINKENINFLKNHGIISYQMSLDGPKEINDTIRSKNNYKNTLNSIVKLLKNDIKVTIKSVISSYNILHIKDLIKDLSSISSKISYNFCRFVPNNEAQNKYIIDISKNDYKRFLEDIFEFFNNENKMDLLIREHLLIPILFEKNILDEVFIDRINYIKNNYKKINFIDGCSMWRDFYVLEINGDVLACKKFPLKFGNIFNDDFIDIKFKKDNFFYNNYHECNDCKLFLLCKGCPAVNYALNKNIFSKDIHCWL